jgi:hypothetical protein
MRAHFRHLSFKRFSMFKGTFQFNDFWPLKLPFEDLGVHWDSHSQSGSSFRSMEVHSFTFSYTPKSMKCDSWVSFWPMPLQTFALIASPRLGLWQYFTYDLSFSYDSSLLFIWNLISICTMGAFIVKGTKSARDLVLCND